MTGMVLLIRWGDGWVVIGVEMLLLGLEKILLLLLLWAGNALLLLVLMWEIQCCGHWIGISSGSIVQHVLLLQFMQAIGAAMRLMSKICRGIALERVPLVVMHF